jgi:uncharacterized OsmC-like protein
MKKGKNRGGVMAVIHGVDVDKMKQDKQDIIKNSTLADRRPTVEATWQGGNLAEVKLGELTTHIGGDNNLTAMQTLLASLAACEVDIIAAHAALADIKLDELTVEATGQFNRSAYFGIEGAPSPAYSRIDYIVRLKAPGITQQQIEMLKEVCENFSPVGDSLSKSIPLHVKIETE